MELEGFKNILIIDNLVLFIEVIVRFIEGKMI